MIDIHCHPLYGTDDGAESLDVSLAMLRMSAEDGVTHVVATPHCNFQFPYNAERNRARVAELQAKVGDAPKLLLGCDFHLSYENIRRLTEDHVPYGVNATQYLLVEFDSHFIPELMNNVFYDIQVAGFTPILTHPERNAVCRSKPLKLYEWLMRGCLLQITAQSYTGDFGSEAARAVDHLLDLNMVHVVASDAHDTKQRPPLLSPAYNKMAAERGQELADLLFAKNPEAIISGKPLPPGPQPISPGQRKKKWWSFGRG
ncbi:MAG: tyrosine-protein phosphatase [Terriglobia bacterium]